MKILTAIALLCGLAAAEAGAQSRRSSELFRHECSNEHGRRDVTLFANGTVRLREGLWEDQQMYLDELKTEQLESYLALLAEIRESAAEPSAELPDEVAQGEWIERCQLRLDLPGLEPLEYSFSPYQIPDLSVSRLIHVADDLAEFTEPPTSPDRLPAAYEPRPGDVLVTPEGDRFEVLRFTADRRAVELSGLDVPLRMFVSVDELQETFASREGDEEAR